MSRPVIAVVEDEPALLDVMTDLLTEEGYRVACHRELGRAFDLVAGEWPGLVMVAVHLHDQHSALSLLARRRGDPATRAIPTLVYSADSRFLERHETELEQLGAATLELPFDLDELLFRVARLIAPRVAAPERMARWAIPMTWR